MNKNLTDITIIIDRSGSMSSCRTDAEGGLNTFVKTQAAQPGDALLTIVQFDDKYEFVHSGIPIKTAPEFILIPRGMTALYDAVGRAINETGERLAKTPEHERPGLVLFTIITDGHENASREFTGAQVKEMIERQTNEYQWQFEFLGANQDAFKAASNIGIPANNTLNYDTHETQSAFTSLGAKSCRTRSLAAQGLSYSGAGYTDNERLAAAGDSVSVHVTIKDPAAVSLGRRGGAKGGYARAQSLSPEQRTKIATDAAKARWQK
jgi:hypothetical protein